MSLENLIKHIEIFVKHDGTDYGFEKNILKPSMVQMNINELCELIAAIDDFVQVRNHKCRELKKYVECYTTLKQLGKESLFSYPF